MPNHYFQFKNFRIEQDRCAMKVCTDACLFGAWIPANNSTGNILDVGTGTGLLSLMMAQKTTAHIDAVEIDEAAFLQAKENTANSSYNERISVFWGDFNNFKTQKKYDLIISNPPFYENQLHSADAKDRTAKHATALTLENLFKCASHLLKETGKLAILLPYYRKADCLKWAQLYKLYPEQSIEIQQTQHHASFRYAALFTCNGSVKPQDSTFSIKDADGNYSQTATSLLKPFYQYL
ncbi:MAG: methyltransferase [Sphingobacteriales bacterium]|nr:methyltransferase [Sphingobacteriales bacterium]